MKIFREVKKKIKKKSVCSLIKERSYFKIFNTNIRVCREKGNNIMFNFICFLLFFFKFLCFPFVFKNW